MTFVFVKKTVFIAILAILSLATGIRAESHTVRFNNQCGHGSPVLLRAGQILSNGEDYTSNGPLSSAIAYLQTGNCLLNGENCAIVEMTLGNPTCPGCGSSTDISLIAPHALNVPTGFSYFNGCDGAGATCDTATCTSAFFQPNDNQVQVACQTDNVDLLITFCGDGSSQPSSSASPQSSRLSTSSSVPHTTLTSTDSQVSHSSSSVGTQTTTFIATTTPSTATLALTTVASEPTVTSSRTAVSNSNEPTVAPTQSASSETQVSPTQATESEASVVPTQTIVSEPSVVPTHSVVSVPTVVATHVVSQAWASPSTAASIPGKSPIGTPSASTCRRSTRQKKKRANTHVQTEVRLERRELYDARIRAIAGHA